MVDITKVHVNEIPQEVVVLQNRVNELKMSNNKLTSKLGYYTITMVFITVFSVIIIDYFKRKKDDK